MRHSTWLTVCIMFQGKQLALKVSLTTPGMIEYLHIVKDNIFRDKKLRGDGSITPSHFMLQKPGLTLAGWAI